jgi:hypothetical protein
MNKKYTGQVVTPAKKYNNIIIYQTTIFSMTNNFIMGLILYTITVGSLDGFYCLGLSL